jgi:hypothetical protein
MKIGRYLCAFLILGLALVVLGCPGTLPNPGAPASSTAEKPSADAWKLEAYNALAESKVAYDRAFTALGLADQMGKLRPEDKARSIKYGKMYKEAHNQAVTQLLNNQRPEMFAMKTALGAFEAIALPYMTQRKE